MTYLLRRLARLICEEFQRMANLNDVSAAVANLGTAIDGAKTRVAALPAPEDTQPLVDTINGLTTEVNAIAAAQPAAPADEVQPVPAEG